MRIYVVGHAPFESPGIILDWAKRRNFILEQVSPYQGDSLKSPREWDALIVMGGPQSVLDLADLPYLQKEVSLIQEAARQEKPVLGICLGAQLIGQALHAQGERSPNKEVGVFPIFLTQAGKSDELLEGFPAEFLVTHWHGDMPGLPPESEILAESVGCPRQIIRFRKRVYGFQCHLEMTSSNIETMIENCSSDLLPGKFVQTAEELKKQNYQAICSKMEVILDRWVKI